MPTAPVNRNGAFSSPVASIRAPVKQHISDVKIRTRNQLKICDLQKLYKYISAM